MPVKELPISAFCTTASGGTPSRSKPEYYNGGTIPWVKSGELHSPLITDTEEHLSEAGLAGSSAKLVPSGAILLAMYGATVGTVSQLGIPATTNQAVCSIIPDEDICDKRYLIRCLESKYDEFISKSVGGGQPNISQQIIKATKIPLPSLPEQRRIAAILDKADQLHQKRRQAIEKLDQLLQSVFLDMFGDPVTNPKGWPEGSIEVVTSQKSDVRCGPFGTQLKVGELVSSGVPLLGIENVHNNKFIRDCRKFLTEEKAQQLKAFSVLPGDVLITRMGTIGRACVVPSNFGEARISYHLFRVRPDPQKCIPEFLASSICRSGVFQAQLKRLARGAIMSGLNTSLLKEVKFLLPSVELQERYLRIVEKCETEMNLLNEAAVSQEVLFNSLKQRAFNGTL